MTYQITPNGTIFCITSHAFIPSDPANTDFQAYLAWLEAGNTPEPAPVPEPAAQFTARERLEAAGFSIPELRELLFADG